MSMKYKNNFKWVILNKLKNYYKYLPSYWNKLKDLQSKTERPMKYNKYSVYDLEEKFRKEDSGM